MPKCSEMMVLSWYYFFHFPFFSSCIVIWRTQLIFSYFHQVDNTASKLWEEGEVFLPNFLNLWSVTKSKYIYSRVVSWNFIYCRDLHFDCLQVILSLESVPCGAKRVCRVAEDVPHFRGKKYVQLGMSLLTQTVGLSCGGFGWSLLSIPFYRHPFRHKQPIPTAPNKTKQNQKNLSIFLLHFGLSVRPCNRAAQSQSLQVTRILRDGFYF